METQMGMTSGVCSARTLFRKIFASRLHNQSMASWIRVVPLTTVLMLTSCASETLFRSNFDQTPVDQPPATLQDPGTAHIHGPAGSVLVVAPPVLPSGASGQIHALSVGASLLSYTSHDR